jgi:surfactin synthase thioesterase subunit
LFCFPYAGGGAAVYNEWFNEMPSSIDVCAIEPPGRLVRGAEPAHAELPDFVRALDSALEDQLDRPFAIFGYSLGGLMAFEWARALQRRGGRQPTQLIIAACSAPHLPSLYPSISHQTDDAFLPAVEQRYGELDRYLRSDPDMLARILGILRTDLRMLERYRYDPAEPLDCPILVVGGRDDLGLGRPRLEAWQAQTTSTCRVEILPGDHFFLRTQSVQLLSLVREFIAQDSAMRVRL